MALKRQNQKDTFASIITYMWKQWCLLTESDKTTTLRLLLGVMSFEIEWYFRIASEELRLPFNEKFLQYLISEAWYLSCMSARYVVKLRLYSSRLMNMQFIRFWSPAIQYGEIWLQLGFISDKPLKLLSLWGRDGGRKEGGEGGTKKEWKNYGQ